MNKFDLFLGYRVEMLDIQSGRWVEVTFIDGYEPKCTLSNILYGIMYRFRVVCLNDAGPSQPGEPSEPIVIDVPGVQIAPYFVQMLNDTIALEHEKVLTIKISHACIIYLPEFFPLIPQKPYFIDFSLQLNPGL